MYALFEIHKHDLNICLKGLLIYSLPFPAVRNIFSYDFGSSPEGAYRCKMQFSAQLTAALASLHGLAHAQQLAQDPGTKGPPVEIVDLYNDLYPQGEL